MVLGIVNESTTAIQIRDLSAGDIVYISSSTVPGHFVSIFDQTGCVTTPVLLSTNGVYLSGVSEINQRFGYVSMVADTSSSWIVVNQAPFMEDESMINALDAKSISATDVTTTVLSTITATTCDLETTNLVTLEGRASTIAAGAQGNLAASFGPMYVVGNVTLGVTVSDSFNTRFQVNATSIYSMSINARNTTVGGNITAAGLTANRISGKTLAISSLNSDNISASTLTVKGLGALSTATSIIGARDLRLGPSYISSGLLSAVDTPWASTNMISSSQLYTSSIQLSDISGLLSSIEMGNAVIQNSQGSLSSRSISANTSKITSILATTLSTQTLNTPAIIAANPVQISSIGGNDHLRATNMYLTDCSIGTAASQALTASTLFSVTISPSSFTVNTGITLAGPAFYFPTALFNDICGSTTAPSTEVSSTTVRNLYTSTIGVPIFSTKALNMAYIDVSNASTAIATMNTIHIDRQTTLGTPFNYSTLTPTGPWMSTFAVVDVSGGYLPLTSPPYQTASGFGVYNNPFTTVNVYNTTISFSFNSAPAAPLYFNIKYRHTNAGAPGGGVVVYLNGHIIILIDNAYRDPLLEGARYDLNMNDYPIVSPNPITGDNTPWCSWNVGSSGVTVDSMTMWISNNLYARDRVSNSIMDPKAGIEMNVASMKWPSTVFTTTIENSFNDIQTRSLLYTGALRNLSDRSLKKDVVGADLARCAAIVKMPLRRYQYVPEYVSTFKTRDRTRLGILTTELADPFPKSVLIQETPMGPAQTASLGQLKYAHLGATKFLMEEIAALKTDLARLRSA